MNAYSYPGLRMAARQIKESNRPSADEVITACAEAWGTCRKEMETKTRVSNVVMARFAAMYLFRFALNYSIHAAGRPFGKDHSTVIYATKVVRQMLIYPEFQERFSGVCYKIGYK